LLKISGSGREMEEAFPGNYAAICWLRSKNINCRLATSVGETGDFEPIGLLKRDLKNYQ